MGRVVVCTEALAETLPDEREGSQGRDQRDLKRVPKQISKVGLCVWMHGHGITSLFPRGNRPRRFVRVDVEHTLLIDRFVLVVEVDEEHGKPEDGGGVKWQMYPNNLQKHKMHNL